MPSKRRTAKEHSPNHFKVDWREDYGPDIISLNWFKEIGTANKAHTFGKRGKAYCQVVVSDSTADLIYDDEFLDDNTRLEVMLGRARFKFADEARTNVSEVLWCGDGSGRSEPVTNCAVKKLYIPPSSSIEGDIENRVIKTPVRDRRLADKKRLQVGPDAVCEVCKRSLRSLYGQFAHDAADVHHTRELRKGRRETIVDHLAFVCACCHAILSRKSKIATSVEEIQKHLKEFGSGANTLEAL